MNISEISVASKAFTEELQKIKTEFKPYMPPGVKPEWEFGDQWYSYNSIGNISFFDQLLTGNNRNIFSVMKDRPIADIGAADGDVGFFFSRLGFDVDIVDNPSTNWNNFRGAKTLKRILDSPAKLYEVNLDAQFRLPQNDYGMVFFLGILYHLQNPYHGLLHLARVADYCFLSTRIASFAAGVKIKDLSIAYLLGPDECNNDSTNYWVFSQAGLKKIISRTGWEILDWKTFGDTETSDVSALDRDERAFALLRSRIK